MIPGIEELPTVSLVEAEAMRRGCGCCCDKTAPNCFLFLPAVDVLEYFSLLPGAFLRYSIQRVDHCARTVWDHATTQFACKITEFLQAAFVTAFIYAQL